MSQDELNTLRAEALPAPETEPVTEAVMEEMAPVADPALVQALSMAIYGLSIPACRRANVTPLVTAEADVLGQALAQLVTVYDLGPKDPKGAAWMGFGLACIGVVSARRPLAPVVAEEAEIAASPPPSFGDVAGVVETAMDRVPGT
ncbi:hypothetical protein A6A04_08995 [Paramagnetospirillum marisnigri]|uniref:Uncharacterized protein n=1 Tax=Paramagnetospirillum marisnigri TaxID=1285242 RepID=A0A178M7H4_9PROT|nr:hypothetical protein [Paramagnetospirillum marisnigri]OAN44008.1 hypothetical protein A6A04_08995 [Paramagnetospirillum marisnigri]